MIRRAAELGGADLRAEVCVIGSGAGGAVAASKLAEKGLDVVLLEEGEYLPTRDMSQDELDMIPRLFQEGGRRTTRDQSVLIMQGRALGGGTAHNTGLCVPVAEPVWEQWRRDHAAPLPFDEFQVYLERVLTAIRARRADDDELNENNLILQRGAESLGLSHFRARHNRLECSGCGYCTLGCAYNRKMSVCHAFLPGGVAAGLRIVTGARALRIDDSGRGREVICDRLRIQAPVVIVAAGAVHTPGLLARSGLARGLRVGRDLRLHPFAPVGAIFSREIKAWRGVPQSVIVDDRAHFLRGGAGGYLLMVAAAQPAVSAALTSALGRDARRIMTSYDRLAAAGVARLGSRCCARSWSCRHRWARR